MTTYTSEWTTVTWPIGASDVVRDPVPIWLFAPGVTSYSAVATIRAASLTGSRTGDISVDVEDVGGANLERLSHTEFTIANGSTPTVTFTGTSDRGYIRFAVNGGGLLPHSSETFQYQIVATFDSQGAYCTYGVQSNPDAPYNTVITTSLIELVASIALARLGQEDKVPYVTAALQVLAGQVMKTVDCSRLPTPDLVTDMTDFNGQHIDALTTWFYNAAWNYFCKCTPAPSGSPDPVKPPPPVILSPGDAISTTTPVVCDTGDLCTILNAIMSKLDSLTANVSYSRRDIQVLQRQTSPFAYIPDTRFSDLTGAGELAVSDILALSVQSTTVPPSISLISADPLEYRFLGRISLGNADGWQRQIMISHNPHLVLPIDGTVTRIGYSLQAGVVADIVTLKMEPLG